MEKNRFVRNDIAMVYKTNDGTLKWKNCISGGNVCLHGIEYTGTYIERSALNLVFALNDNTGIDIVFSPDGEELARYSRANNTLTGKYSDWSQNEKIRFLYQNRDNYILWLNRGQKIQMPIKEGIYSDGVDMSSVISNDKSCVCIEKNKRLKGSKGGRVYAYTLIKAYHADGRCFMEFEIAPSHIKKRNNFLLDLFTEPAEPECCSNRLQINGKTDLTNDRVLYAQVIEQYGIIALLTSTKNKNYADRVIFYDREGRMLGSIDSMPDNGTGIYCLHTRGTIYPCLGVYDRESPTRTDYAVQDGLSAYSDGVEPAWYDLIYDNGVFTLIRDPDINEDFIRYGH